MAWGEIAAAGISAIASLFGGKKKQTTTSEVDYSKMAANAQAAGYNPLTAIRNGGSAGFTTTTSPTISAMPEVLGNLGGILGNALDKKLDPIEAKKREIDTILLDRQLGQLKMGPQVPGGWKPRSTFEGTKVSTQLAPRVGPSATSKSASVPQAYDIKPIDGYETESAKHTNYGNQPWWRANPWMPAASTIEDDYGDLASYPYGFVKVGVDLGYNGARWTMIARDAYRKKHPINSKAALPNNSNARSLGSAVGKMFKPKFGPPRPSLSQRASMRDLNGMSGW